MGFDRAIEHVLKVEGGYVNDPADSGGETNFGITVFNARRGGYTGPMRDMTREQAKEIYRRLYWDAQNLSAVASINYPVAFELFDTCVNMGEGRAGEFLQRSLNVLNDQGRLYRDITVDNRIGPQTLGALTAYLRVRPGAQGEKVLLRCLNSLQGAFYINLAERRQKDQRFLFGWMLNRVVI